MVPSSAMISQITPASPRPAMRERSTIASVWPARTRTPPSMYLRGKTCPGLPRSSGCVDGSTSALIVAARSWADIPVVAPFRTSTETVNAVPNLAVLSWTISGSLSCSSRSATSGTHISPRPCMAMKLTASGVTAEAAMARSPSFSRSSSSTMMTILPALMSSTAWRTFSSGTVEPACCNASGNRDRGLG